MRRRSVQALYAHGAAASRVGNTISVARICGGAFPAQWSLSDSEERTPPRETRRYALCSLEERWRERSSDMRTACAECVFMAANFIESQCVGRVRTAGAAPLRRHRGEARALTHTIGSCLRSTPGSAQVRDGRGARDTALARVVRTTGDMLAARGCV